MQRPSVLLFDNDEEFHRKLERDMEKIGITLYSRKTLPEFLMAYKQLLPKVCLIDMDLRGSDLSAVQVVKTLRNRIGSDVIIIGLSRMITKFEITKSLEAKVNDYFAKPINIDLLETKLAPYLKFENRANFSPIKINPDDSVVDLKFKMFINKVTGTGIIWRSCSPVYKKTVCHVSTGLAEEITGISDHPIKLTVTNCEKLNSINGEYYLVETLFDIYDGNIIENVKNWLIKHS